MAHLFVCIVSCFYHICEYRVVHRATVKVVAGSTSGRSHALARKVLLQSTVEASKNCTKNSQGASELYKLVLELLINVLVCCIQFVLVRMST